MNHCVMLGGTVQHQKKFLAKVQALGYDLEYAGGYDADVNPAYMNIPDNCVCMVLKDKISHKQRDLARDLCETKEGVTFIEVSSKISHAINTLVLVLGETDFLKAEDETEDEEIDSSDPLEHNAFTPKNPTFASAVLNCPWMMFPFDPNHAGSRKTLSNYWLTENRKRSKKHDDDSFMPSKGRIKRGEAFNPMLKASDVLREPQNRSTTLLSAKAWLLGADDQDFKFRSKFSLDRALNMTFRLSSSDLPEALWEDLIEIQAPRKKKKKSPSKSLPKPAPKVNLQPLKPTESAMPEIQDSQPSLTDAQPPLKDTQEKILEDTNTQDGVFICGSLLQISGDLKIQTISVKDLRVSGPYNVSIGSIDNNILNEVTIKPVRS